MSDGSSPNYHAPIIPCGNVQTLSKMEDDAVPTIEELKKLKVVDLKARLASLGLQTSGSLDYYLFHLFKVNFSVI